MIARDERGVCKTHSLSALFVGDVLFIQAASPPASPCVECLGVREQDSHLCVTFDASCRIADAAKRQREICVVRSHAIEQVLSQCQVVVVFREKAELAPETAQ